MIKYSYFFFALFFFACSQKYYLRNCKLIPEENKIIGRDQDAITLQNKAFVSYQVEKLLDRTMTHEIEKFALVSKEEFIEYSITGCRDTAWAKKRMAEHLLQKYDIYFHDSSYLRNVYDFKIIDEKKFMDRCLRKDNCKYETIISFKKQEDGTYTHDYLCVDFDWIPGVILHMDYNPKTFQVHFDPIPGKYDFSVPAFLIKEEGFDSMKDFLKTKYGIKFDHIAVDTVQVSVYKRWEEN